MTGTTKAGQTDTRWHVEGDPNERECSNGWERVEAKLASGEIVTAYLAESVCFSGWQWMMDTKGWHKECHGGKAKRKRVNVVAWRRRASGVSECTIAEGGKHE